MFRLKEVSCVHMLNRSIMHLPPSSVKYSIYKSMYVLIKELTQEEYHVSICYIQLYIFCKHSIFVSLKELNRSIMHLPPSSVKYSIYKSMHVSIKDLTQQEYHVSICYIQLSLFCKHSNKELEYHAPHVLYPTSLLSAKSTIYKYLFY